MCPQHCSSGVEEPLPAYAPLYYSSYTEEISDEPLPELSSMPEPAELADVPPHSSNLTYLPGQMRAAFLDHGYNMSLERHVPRTIEPMDTRRSPLSLNTQDSFVSAPGLISGQQSQISSSVSSVTPETNIICGAQLGSNEEFRKETEPHFNMYSPSQHSWAETNTTQDEQKCDWQGGRVPPSSMDLAKTLFASAGGSLSPSSMFPSNDVVEYSSWEYSDGVPMHCAGSTASHPSQGSTAITLPQSRGLKSIPLGAYQLESEGWHYSPVDGLDRNDAEIGARWQSRSQPGQFDGQQQPTTIFAEHHDHTYPEAVEYPVLEEGADAPSVPCSECHRVFHGKYCSTNMMRHVRVVHRGTAARACSSCKQWFRRSDALRKHERDRHKVLSAEAKTRVRS